ncbi:MAG: VOC family protein [Crocinitomicaceae bacterium]|nr:VOC family protein [Crocinitomicaceae bacterium]
MKLGSFSVSLSVKDIYASKAFYEKLGFTEAGGNLEQNWLILRNGETVIGIFQGMFPNNVLTFNPGWDQQAQNLEKFNDVREIQKSLKAEGMNFATEADENTILVDQHR